MQVAWVGPVFTAWPQHAVLLWRQIQSILGGRRGGGVLQCQYAVPTAVFLSLIFETQALLLLYVLIMCMQVYAGLACPEQSPLTLRILTVPGLEQHPILSTNISRVHIVIGRC